MTARVVQRSDDLERILAAPRYLAVTARVVQRSDDLERILALPRRQWPPELAEQLAERLTKELRTENGTWSLRPIQAIALLEAKLVGGVFCPIRVGGGKTLVSLLLATVLDARKPILLVPAKLRDKTKRDLATLRNHWRISPVIRIESYETLSRENHAAMLETWRPDLIVCDEAHRVKNPRAAVTRRLLRALGNGCRFVAMSGTATRRSIRDYAHLLTKALGPANTPIPTERYSELEDWSAALDETKGEEREVDLGALRLFLGPEEDDAPDELTACRRAFRRRLVQTPGVVATDESQLGVSLTLRRVAPPVPSAGRAALTKLRNDWVLPDGSPVADGVSVWRHARELALGFYYRWDPSPPNDWLAARREWCSACREILSENRTHLDSELQVIKAIDTFKGENAVHRISGEMCRRGAGPLARWRAIKDSFKPNTVPVWLDGFAVDYVLARSKAEPMLVWVEHRAFAAALEQRGLDYYGGQGRNRRRQMVEDADPTRSIAVSIASNAEGRNLQAWCRNLVTSPLTSGRDWEQLLGRTHRDGQLADEVECHWLSTCTEHDEAMAQAVQDARYIEATTGSPQKLLVADST